jgi:hypothetical protein
MALSWNNSMRAILLARRRREPTRVDVDDLLAVINAWGAGP